MAKILTDSWEMGENLADSWDSSTPILTLILDFYATSMLWVWQ